MYREWSEFQNVPAASLWKGVSGVVLLTEPNGIVNVVVSAKHSLSQVSGQIACQIAIWRSTLLKDLVRIRGTRKTLDLRVMEPEQRIEGSSSCWCHVAGIVQSMDSTMNSLNTTISRRTTSPCRDDAIDVLVCR